jgi:hypothetical protein
MTKTLELVHPRETLKVPFRTLVLKCNLFSDDPALACAPYSVQAPVSVDDFRQFVLALEDKDVEMTNANFGGLSLLCDEFRFTPLSERLSAFRQSADFKEVVIAEVRHSQTAASLAVLPRLDRSFTFMANGVRLECDVSEAVAVSAAVRQQLSVDACAYTFSLIDVGLLDSLRCIISGTAVSDERSLSALGRQLCNPMLELQSVCPETDRFDLNSIDLSSLSVDALDQILTEGSFYIKSEDNLFLRILRLGSEYGPLLRHIEIGFLSVSALAECFAFPPECIWSGISRFLGSGFRSTIISDLPEILAEFRSKRFALLWRGGCDDFRGCNFHSCCDGHANILTLIDETNGNIFGRFTPLEWESRDWNGKNRKEDNRYKADANLKSFLCDPITPTQTPTVMLSLAIVAPKI